MRIWNWGNWKPHASRFSAFLVKRRYANGRMTKLVNCMVLTREVFNNEI